MYCSGQKHNKFRSNEQFLKITFSTTLYWLDNKTLQRIWLNNISNETSREIRFRYLWIDDLREVYSFLSKVYMNFLAGETDKRNNQNWCTLAVTFQYFVTFLA